MPVREGSIDDFIKMLPTHTCFDDALEFIAAVAKEYPKEARGKNVYLCHGICKMPNGELYSHAWVERDNAGVVYNSAIIDGKKVYNEFPKKWFYDKFEVQERTRYTIYQAYRQNERTLKFGPWVDKYKKLCRDYKE